MNKKRWNVLVFPGGTEVGLEIYRSLQPCKEVRLFSVSSDVTNHASYLFARHDTIPTIYDERCLTELNRVIERNAIDFLFPANPLVMDFLQGHSHSIRCNIIMPNREGFEIARSKRRTYEKLRHVVPVPVIYDTAACVPDRFPVYIKPDAMYGSQGGRKVDTKAQLDANPATRDELVCEYLPGKEYTVDCFSTRTHGLLYARGRHRQRIRMGTSMHGCDPSPDVGERLNSYAKKIQSCLKLTGPWFFQMKQNAHHELVLLEVDPRVAGTMAMSRIRGINIPLLALYDAAGRDVDVMVNAAMHIEIDRALANRYRHDLQYSSVYVDLDDTLIVKEQLNTDLVKFLYQCVNQGKQLTLISKSLAGDKNGVLKKWRIDSLFDEVIWLQENQSKADFIGEPDAIFIDDSFSQRKEVAFKRNIPTFDGSMIELLIDDRRY